MDVAKRILNVGKGKRTKAVAVAMGVAALLQQQGVIHVDPNFLTLLNGLAFYFLRDSQPKAEG